MNLPYNQIILVDDSDDRTPDIAKELGSQVYRVEGLLGQKRIMQAKLSNTEWIACIDSDVVLYPNWFSELEKYVTDNKVSSCSGHLDSDFTNAFSDYQKYMIFCSKFRMLLTNRLGAMSNVLIRRSCLLFCEPYLENVHAGEDTIIGRVLKKRGYRHVLTSTPLGFHWHKNAFEHHRMAYHRAGVSARMNEDYMGRALLTGRYLTLQAFQLTLFSILNSSINTELFRFMYYISLLYLSGLHDSEHLKSRALAKLMQIENRLTKLSHNEVDYRNT